MFSAIDEDDSQNEITWVNITPIDHIQTSEDPKHTLAFQHILEEYYGSVRMGWGDEVCVATHGAKSAASDSGSNVNIESMVRSAQRISTDRALRGLTNKDIGYLAPETWLNDTIIDCVLSLFMSDLEISNPDMFLQVHLFSTFFYEKLKIPKVYREISYDGVKTWADETLFDKKYIIVPINESNHWYVAIIYQPQNILKGPSSTIIFTLDSKNTSHPRAIIRLKCYLKTAAERLKNVQCTGTMDEITVTVPSQNNTYDCGMYLLHFVKRFLHDPDEYTKSILNPPTGSDPQNVGSEYNWEVDEHFERNGRQVLLDRIKAEIRMIPPSPPQQEGEEDIDGDIEIVDVSESRRVCPPQLKEEATSDGDIEMIEVS